MNLESASLNGINNMFSDYAQWKGLTANPIENRVDSFSKQLSATEAFTNSNELPILADQSEKMASEFESLFYSMLLKEMRNTISLDGEGGLFPGENSDTLGSLFDQYLGQHLAESHRLGIGDAINSYMAASRTDNLR